jgi:solute carrier family 7 (cationic amino acid transporter), member 3
VTIGELVAFTIGWNIILECIVGAAAIARGLSDQVDYMMMNKISDIFAELVPMDIDCFATYLDFLAFGIIIVSVITVILASGFKKIPGGFKILTLINVATIVVVIVVGLSQADRFNWGIWMDDIPEAIRNGTGPNGGEGEFMPYGYQGVITGAAKAFFAFVGFDRIAMIGGDVKDPHHNPIPPAMFLSMALVFIANVVVSCIVTLMWPYYLQSDTAPILHLFSQFPEFNKVKWLIFTGIVFALFSSLLSLLVIFKSFSVFSISSAKFSKIYYEQSQINCRDKKSSEISVIENT